MEAIQHVPNDTKPTELPSYDIGDHMMQERNVDTQVGALMAEQVHGEEDAGIEIIDTATRDTRDTVYDDVPSMEDAGDIEINIDNRRRDGGMEGQEIQDQRIDNVPDLELTDNIDQEDLSKLLELDTKQGDGVFDAHEILERVMRGGSDTTSGSETGDEDNEEENKENGKELDNNVQDCDDSNESDDDDASSDDDDDVDGSSEHNRNTGVREGKDQQATSTGSDDTRLMKNNSIDKDVTVSPKPTNSGVDDIRTSPVAAVAAMPSASSLEARHVEEGEHSPTTISQEENGPVMRKHQNGMTPMTLQKHNVLMTQMPAQNGIEESEFHDGQMGNNISLPDGQSTISAYARLDFQSFTFYVQTLHVIIGRRSENDFSHKVDVNLGPSKSISRRHAQIFYNFGTGRFELSIIGKNGAFVDDIFVERGNTVHLKNKTKIQIGQIPFQFVLPDQEKGEQLQKSIEPPLSAGLKELDSNVKEENESKKTFGELKAESPVVEDASKDLANGVASKLLPEKRTPQSQTQIQSPAIKRKRERRPPRVPKKVYSLEEIPPKYRTKPTCSYSVLLTECIRKYSSQKGMSLSEIYAGIRELYPYYKYCPDGWQSSVRHNLSLNKSFRKVSKEGKGWLWGLDEDYIAQRELQKKKQAEAAAAKAAAAQERLEQQQQQRARKAASGSANSGSKTGGRSDGKQQNISQTLAANRATPKRSKIDDHQRTMKYLQEQLIILTKNRKGLSNRTIASILTQALAMTINQVTQAAKNKGISGNPLTALMDKNPQHLNLILAAAVNAAASKITNGEIKQLVNMPSSLEVSNTSKKTSNSATSLAKTSHSGVALSKQTNPKEESLTKSPSSFDPSSLSRFFQPKQPARVSPPLFSPPRPTIPQKRPRDQEATESSTSEDSSDSSDNEDDDDDSDGDDNSDDDDDDDDSDDDDDDNEEEDDDDDHSDDDDDDDHSDDDDDVNHNNNNNSNSNETNSSTSSGEDGENEDIKNNREGGSAGVISEVSKEV